MLVRIGSRRRVPWETPLSSEVVLPHEGRKVFVLIRSDKIDAGFERGLPSSGYCFARAKVVSCAPALVLGGRETVQRVKANPITHAVGMVHQGPQAFRRRRSPHSSLGLPAFFHLLPGVVPPAAVVGGPLGKKLLGWKSGGQGRAFLLRCRPDWDGLGRAEEAPPG